MSYLLYCSIYSDLTEDELILIDEQVSKNRVEIKNLAIQASLVIIISFSSVPPANSSGFSVPVSTIEKIQKFENPLTSKFESNYQKFNSESPGEILLLIYSTDRRIYSNKRILKLITELRCGSFGIGTRSLLVFLAIILSMVSSFMIKLPPGIAGPTPNPNIDFGPDFDTGPATCPATAPAPSRSGNPVLKYPPFYDWFDPPYAQKTPMYIPRPSNTPHDEWAGLTRGQRRNSPHENDLTIVQEGRPNLLIGYWQSLWKVKKHGAVHELPYSLGKDGGTETLRSEFNAIRMMRSIADMPNRKNIIWFESGRFQAFTDREFAAIHLYDPDTRVIAVFRKSNGRFVTTCQLTRDEEVELKTTGNFGGNVGRCDQDDWFDSKIVRNLPPESTIEKTGIFNLPDDGFTLRNTLETDVTGPIDNTKPDNP